MIFDFIFVVISITKISFEMAEKPYKWKAEIKLNVRKLTIVIPSKNNYSSL